MNSDERTNSPTNDVRLAPLSAIGWISLLFGVNCGGVLIAVNYLRLKRKRQAILTVLVTLLATVALSLSLEVHENDPEIRQLLVLQVFITLVVVAIANRLQGPLIQQHVSQGGKFMKVWTRLLIGIGMSLLNVFGSSAVVAIMNHFGDTH